MGDAEESIVDAPQIDPELVDAELVAWQPDDVAAENDQASAAGPPTGAPNKRALLRRARDFTAAHRKLRLRGRDIEIASLFGYAALAAFLAITARNARTLQEVGHDWGDDFALYTNQARSLIEGGPGQVVADTKFAVRESGWAFSPYAYPWGFPIVLAPGVLLFGVNFYKLKLFTTALFLLALFLFYVFFARRAGRIGALSIVALIGTNMFSVGWAGVILSEYCYLASLLLAFLVMDWYRRRGALYCSPLWPGIGVGIAVAWTISVRREGLGLLVGLGVLQTVELIAGRHEPHAAMHRSGVLKRFTLPFVSFGAAIVALQMILPADVYQNAAKAGTRKLNIRTNYPFYRGYLAEHIGLKDPGDNPLRWVHNTFIGPKAMTLFLALVVVGMVLRTLMATRQDVWVAATLVAQIYVILSVPFHEGRYFFAVTPLVAYFAYQSLPSIVRLASRAGPILLSARFVAAMGVACLVASNLPGFRNALTYHRTYSYIENGPDTVPAKEMFLKVRELTRPNDVILCFRARAMNLLTGRRAVQNTDLKRMSNVADWYVMEKGSSYSQTLVASADAPAFGLTMVWENTGWVLWRFDDSARLRSINSSIASLVPSPTQPTQAGALAPIPASTVVPIPVSAS